MNYYWIANAFIIRKRKRKKNSEKHLQNPQGETLPLNYQDRTFK